MPEHCRGPRYELHLVGGVHVLVDGCRAEIPDGSKRLLVYVALRGRYADRRQAAGALWPSGGDGRAAGNLRSALWRLRGARLPLIDGDNGMVALARDVLVDVEEINAWAARLVAGCPEFRDLAMPSCWLGALDLLPGWTDEWALVERERMRQRMLHALEALSRELRLLARHAEAVDAAVAAVDAQPLRESAQRVLIEALAAQGDRAGVLRVFAHYRDLVRRELGLYPSPELAAIVATAVGATPADDLRSGVG
jgi:DNA-binding SARP family transcriptional activator